MAFKVVRTIEGAHLGKEKYREIGVEFIVIPCHTEDEIIAATHNADTVLTFLQPFTRRVISELRNCKLIHNIGTGYEGIDIEAATEYGICVSYPGDYCANEVAEHTMSLILACARKLLRLDRAVREGKWDSVAKVGVRKVWSPMFALKGQTLGLIGFGRIARQLIPKAKGFELRVIAFDPYVPSNIFRETGVEAVTLEHLLEESDYVSVNAALTQKRMLGIEQFRRMKPTAYYINTARAEIADEQVLCTALESGYIAGAALDVVEREDEGVGLGHPLLQFENVILTGHSAFYSEQSILELKQRPYEEIARIIRGEWPLWLLNPEVKENFLKRWGKS